MSGQCLTASVGETVSLRFDALRGSSFLGELVAEFLSAKSEASLDTSRQRRPNVFSVPLPIIFVVCGFVTTPLKRRSLDPTCLVVIIDGRCGSRGVRLVAGELVFLGDLSRSIREIPF